MSFAITFAPRLFNALIAAIPLRARPTTRTVFPWYVILSSRTIADFAGSITYTNVNYQPPIEVVAS
jgi:hypothetical protein